MRAFAFVLGGSLVLAACGWNKPAASPENSDDDSSDDSSGSSASGASASAGGSPDTAKSDELDTTGAAPAAPPPAAKATITDDTDVKEAPCTGSVIADLVSVVSEAACELPPNAPPPKVRASKDVLDVRASTDGKVAPGGTAKVSVVFTNKTLAPLPLDFVVDPDPRFQFEVYTGHGGRADRPPGAEPPLPPDVADAPPVDVRTARVTLAPRGKATAVLSWQAVKYRWASKEKAKGALPGRGYPREPAGPLPHGKYVLHLLMPLTDADEGAAHELSQVKLAIEVAGKPAPPPPPPVAAAPPPPPKQEAPAAAAAPPSDASIEQQFLEATGGSSGAATPGAKKKKKKHGR